METKFSKFKNLEWLFPIILKDENCKIILDNVENCALLFTNEDNIDDWELLSEYTTTIIDDIFIMIMGSNYNVVRLKDDIEDGNYEDYFDFERIKADLILNRDTGKYNL